MDANHLLIDDDVAELLRVPTRRVGKLVRLGLLPHIVLPTGEVRFILDEINEWIEAQRHSQGEDAEQTFSLAEIAEDLRCSHSSILSLVRSGELRAIDISTCTSRRAHYRVLAEDLTEFKDRRTVRPVTAPATRRKRARVRQSEVIEFIK